MCPFLFQRGRQELSSARSALLVRAIGARAAAAGLPLLVEGVEGLDILNVLVLVGSNARWPQSFKTTCLGVSVGCVADAGHQYKVSPP